jgi:hypothetical protein
MRHRSSVAAVESDRGELHLVLSPARSIDTHVIRYVTISIRAYPPKTYFRCNVTPRPPGLTQVRRLPPCPVRLY